MTGKKEISESAVDPNRLLPGENPQTQYLEDAEHWISVYTELRDRKLQLIGELSELMKTAKPDARAELDRSDKQLLEAESDRFERRLAFWRSRAADLHS